MPCRASFQRMTKRSSSSRSSSRVHLVRTRPSPRRCFVPPRRTACRRCPPCRRAPSRSACRRSQLFPMPRRARASSTSRRVRHRARAPSRLQRNPLRPCGLPRVPRWHRRSLRACYLLLLRRRGRDSRPFPASRPFPHHPLHKQRQLRSTATKSSCDRIWSSPPRQNPYARQNPYEKWRSGVPATSSPSRPGRALPRGQKR